MFFWFHFFIQDQLKQARSLSSIAKNLGLSSSCLTSYLKLAPKKRQKTRDVKYPLYFKRSKSILRKKGSRLSHEEKEKLERMLWKDMEIKEAYFLKESFYEVLDAQ